MVVFSKGEQQAVCEPYHVMHTKMGTERRIACMGIFCPCSKGHTSFLPKHVDLEAADQNPLSGPRQAKLRSAMQIPPALSQQPFINRFRAEQAGML